MFVLPGVASVLLRVKGAAKAWRASAEVIGSLIACGGGMISSFNRLLVGAGKTLHCFAKRLCLVISYYVRIALKFNFV